LSIACWPTGAHWLAAEGKSYDYQRLFLRCRRLSSRAFSRAIRRSHGPSSLQSRSRPAGSTLHRLPIERRHLAMIRTSLDISSVRSATMWAALRSTALCASANPRPQTAFPSTPHDRPSVAICPSNGMQHAIILFRASAPSHQDGRRWRRFLTTSGLTIARSLLLRTCYGLIRHGRRRIPSSILPPGFLSCATLSSTLSGPLSSVPAAQRDSFRIGGVTLLAAADVNDHIIRFCSPMPFSPTYGSITGSFCRRRP
jgi:hypothetical protein